MASLAFFVAPAGAASYSDSELIDKEAFQKGLQRESERILQRYIEERENGLLRRSLPKNIPSSGVLHGGRNFVFSHFEEDRPIFKAEANADAVISVNAHPVVGHEAFSDITGAGMRAAVWEVLSPRQTHRELAGRVTLRNTTTVGDHATHVIGTLAAAGLRPGVRGVLPELSVEAYDVRNDINEMSGVSATAPGQQASRIYVSNHAYGNLVGWERDGDERFVFFGSFTDDGERGNDAHLDFGRYSPETRAWDALVHARGYYLPVKSAGNERSANAPGDGAAFTHNGVEYIYNSELHPAADGLYKGGYDTIGPVSVAKNVLTVSAVTDAAEAGARSLAGVGPLETSSFGPADDGRIKPDVVASGDELLSSGSLSDNHYLNLSGSSQATPVVTGVALTLHELWRLEMGTAPRASTVKALVIHTADDLLTPGPDYKTGWGMVNVLAAAEAVRAAAQPEANHRAVEDTLTNGATKSFVIEHPGGELRATLAWTDPPSAAVATHDGRQARLVHDLNLVIQGPDDAAHLPFVMPYVGDWTEATLESPAERGPNTTDNIEQVYVEDAPAGAYTVSVSHAGTLGGAQHFSLIRSSGGFQRSDPASLQEAADSELTFSAGGDAPWQVEYLKAFDEGSSLRSGDISVGESSWIEAKVTIEEGQLLSYYLSKSGAGSSSRVLLEVDGFEVSRHTGESDWELYQVFLQPGERTLRWTYTKAVEGESGIDAAWLDHVTLSLVDQPVLAVTPENYEVTVNRGAVNVFVENLIVTNEGLGFMDFTVSSNRPWVTPFPDTASVATGEVAIFLSLDVDDLSPGNREATLTVRATNGDSQEVTVPLALTITDAVSSTPQALPPTDVSSTSFTANWRPVDGATRYLIDVSEFADFSQGNFVEGFENLDVGAATSFEVTGLTPQRMYFYRVRAVVDGEVGDNSNLQIASLPQGGPTYQQWADSNLPIQSRDPDDVLFDDGVANLMRFAFEMPLVQGAGFENLPQLTMEQESGEPVYVFTYAEPRDTVIYTPQFAPSYEGVWLDLEDGMSLLGHTVTVSNASGGRSVRVPVEIAKNGYFRVKVEE